ncbi:MAG TPA: CaiB/BaiF CoA-transferase family protein [Minicystis sp.]|nr:CaiB/BaiF CoA-transferase family protein [Minicystis sp.]
MRPLTGIRVLDLSRLLPGPFATLVLADLGATVDKIEDAQAGDYLRHMPPQVAGESAAFQLLNRGKRSAIVDLKKPDGRAAFLRLVARYDVLFDQFRPGVLERLGLGHAALRAANPRLVVCALTGYGQTGPLAARAGHDLDYLARAGVLGAQGPADGPPAVPGFQMADVSGGLWCAIAILGALRERDRTGEGALLDVAMADGVLGFASTTLAAALAGLSVRRGDEVLSGGIAPYQTYVAKDGAPMALAALEPKFWMAFSAGVGLEPSMEALVPGPHQAALKARVAEIIGSRTRAEWEAFAAERDCCLEPVLAPEELARDAHLAARGLFFSLATPRGVVPQVRLPVTPRDEAFTPPPRAGEHTREILAEAGLSPAEIDALLASGAARAG